MTTITTKKCVPLFIGKDAGKWSGKYWVTTEVCVIKVSNNHKVLKHAKKI